MFGDHVVGDYELRIALDSPSNQAMYLPRNSVPSTSKLKRP